MASDIPRLRAELRRLCDRLATTDTADPVAEIVALDDAETILALTRGILGIACVRCGGYGHRSYSSTATWAGGCGGQAITEGVCDRCWGTGRSDRRGVNLRALRSLAATPTPAATQEQEGR